VKFPGEFDFSLCSAMKIAVITLYKTSKLKKYLPKETT